MSHIIDTHCHLDHPVFDKDRVHVLKHCQGLGINTIIVPGIHAHGWDNLLQICASNRTLMPALGLHPLFLTQHKTAHLAQLTHYAVQHKPVAIGEIGLDFFTKDLDRALQQHFFERQLAIATQMKLPVILHVRKAHDVVLKTLKKGFKQGGIVHAFNGSLQQAEHYITLGFKLGFGGTLTYARSRKLHLLAQKLPLEAIVLETDAPDMVVANHHGERNSPEYIVDSLNSLAQLRQLPCDEVAYATTLNAKHALRLP